MSVSTPCRNYLQGNCPRGLFCRFSHDSPRSPAASRFRANAPSFTPSAKPLSSTVLIPCRFFQKGYCSRGSSCKFAHIGGDAARPTVEDNSTDVLSIEPVSQIESRIMGGSLLVTFGPGMEVTGVSLSTSSPMITIHNLAPSTDLEDIISLLMPFKSNIDGSAVRLSKPGEIGYATVNLEDPDTAKNVIAALDGSLLKTRVISVRPLLKKQDISSSQDATRVSCTWYAPSKNAYAIFDSRLDAVLAASKENRLICGRSIKCALMEVTKGDPGTTSVSVPGLDLKTTIRDIKRVFRCDDVMIGEPTYDLTDEETGIFVRSLFETDRRLQGFEIVSPPGAAKIKAVVRFKTAEEARAVLKEVNGVKQEFLGDSPLHLTQVFSAKFKVIADVHRAVAAELAEISKDAKKYFVRVKVFEGITPSSLVTISVNGPDRNTMSSTKALIKKLVRGEVICDESGTAVWDHFLVTTQGIRLIKNLISTTGAYIYYDLRKRQLSSYGRLTARIDARTKLLEEIKLFNSQRHVIPLEINKFWNAMLGGLGLYEEEYGTNRISLDITTKSIIFKGSPTEAGILSQRLIRELSEEPLERKFVAEEDCLICLTKAEDPKVSPCGHLYCQTCLQDYLRSSIETRKFPIRCVGTQSIPTCTSEFPLPYMQKALSKTELDDLFAAAFGDYVQRHLKDYQYCPTPDCSTVYRTSETGECITCTECFVSICTRCHVEAHDGKTCADYKVSIDTEGEEKFQEWKKGKDVKSCPNCNSLIEKTGGCNHVQCLTCKGHICWECLGVFKEGDIYDHMNSEHGNIGVDYF